MREYSAPGKLLILGEYAVLFGSYCVAQAVPRRVRIQETPGMGYATIGAHFDRSLVDAIEKVSGKSVEGLTCDVSELYEEGIKLGLGSSAASAVAICAAVLGNDDPQAVFPTALRAHRAFQGGRGSGADVAASTYGGTISYRLLHEQGTEALVEPRHINDVAMVAVWTGTPASSTSMIEPLMAQKEQAPTRRVLARMEEIVERWREGGSTMAAISAYDAAMEELGDLLNTPIITPAHRALRRQAAALGLVTKPSGAGGGDFSIVAGDAEAIRGWDHDYLCIPLEDAPGVRVKKG